MNKRLLVRRLMAGPRFLLLLPSLHCLSRGSRQAPVAVTCAHRRRVHSGNVGAFLAPKQSTHREHLP
uniref:Putative secreted protein n=1 Tax=Anopheles marajoara TaxID=58244 RepID=A0A2M4CFX6_9DIPT